MGRDTLVLTISFVLIFSGFSSSEVFVETLQRSRGFDDLGIWMMILIYAFYCLSSIFAWKIVDRIGTKRGLIGAASLYMIFVAVLTQFSPLILLIVSALLGISAGILWNSYRTHFVLSTDPVRLGRFMSVAELTRILAVVGSSSLLGYLNAHYGFITGQSFALTLSIIGWLFLFLLKNSFSNQNRNQTNTSSDFSSIFSSVTLMRMVSTVILATLVGGLMRGVLPILVEQNISIAAIGYLNSVLLLGQTVGNLLSSVLADSKRKSRLMIGGSLISLTGVAFLSFCPINFFALAVAGLLLGVGRALTGVSTAAFIPEIAKDHLSIAHSTSTFMESMGFVIPLILGIIFPPKEAIIFCFVIASLIAIQAIELLRKESSTIRRQFEEEISKSPMPR